MNRKLLALAVAAAMATPLAAQAAPTVYGKIETSLEYAEEGYFGGSDDVWNVNSNTSKLGFKGSEKLSDSLNALYKIEYGFSSDSAEDDLYARERFLGLESQKLGTVRVGQITGPIRALEGNIDQFNERATFDIETMDDANWGFLNNAVVYNSPKFADAITVSVALQQGETNGSSNTGNGVGDGVELSVTYEQNGLYLGAGLAQDTVEGYQQNGVDVLRLAAAYTTGALQFGGIFTTIEYDYEEEETLTLSMGYQLSDKNKFKAQLMMNELSENGGSWDSEATVLALGLDHSLSQATTAYVQLGYGEWEATSYGYNYPTEDGFTLGVGVAHNF